MVWETVESYNSINLKFQHRRGLNVSSRRVESRDSGRTKASAWTTHYMGNVTTTNNH